METWECCIGNVFLTALFVCFESPESFLAFLSAVSYSPGGRVVNTTLWLDASRECPGWPGKMVLLWWHCRRQRASLSWREAQRGSSHLKTLGKLPVCICINTLGNEARPESHRCTGENRSFQRAGCVKHRIKFIEKSEKSFLYIFLYYQQFIVQLITIFNNNYYCHNHLPRGLLAFLGSICAPEIESALNEDTSFL